MYGPEADIKPRKDANTRVPPSQDMGELGFAQEIQSRQIINQFARPDLEGRKEGFVIGLGCAIHGGMEEMHGVSFSGVPTLSQPSVEAQCKGKARMVCSASGFKCPS